MRIRLSLAPPFPATKILLPVTDHVKSITDLKKTIIQSLSSVNAVVKHAKELSLTIEGFELLAGSGLDILQDQDVVCVGLAASSSASSVIQGSTKKRKHSSAPRDSSDLEYAQPKRARLENGKTPKQVVSIPLPKQEGRERSSSTTSSSSSSSSSSNSSSSSSTSSTSETSSESSSSQSLSSSAGPPSEERTHLSGFKSNKDGLDAPKAEFPILPNPRSHAQPQSAPGQGLSKTQERNARRRKAREYKQLEAQQTPLSLPEASPITITPSIIIDKTASIESVNGSSTSTDVQLPAELGPTLPLSRVLFNKNKKKGFMKAMTGVRGSKTVFDELELPQADVTTSGETSLPEQLDENSSLAPIETEQENTPIRPTRYVKIIPPSEQPDLPSNVFVTSVSYDWKRSRTSAKAASELDEDEDEERAEEEGDEHVDAAEAGTTTRDEAHSRRGEMEIEIETGRIESSDGDTSRIWRQAEERFDSLPILTQYSFPLLEPGKFLTWKDLDLDLYTFTPQIMLKIGKVQSVEHEAVTVEILPRSGVVEEMEWNGEGGQSEQLIFILTLDDIRAGDGKWRIIDA